MAYFSMAGKKDSGKSRSQLVSTFGKAHDVRSSLCDPRDLLFKFIAVFRLMGVERQPDPGSCEFSGSIVRRVANKKTRLCLEPGLEKLILAKRLMILFNF